MIKNKSLLRRILIELIENAYTGRTLNKMKLFVRIKMPNSTPIKHIRILFRLKRENNAIKYKLIRDIRTLFASTEEEYYEPVRLGNAFSNNYIEYKNNNDKNKTLSLSLLLSLSLTLS